MNPGAHRPRKILTRHAASGLGYLLRFVLGGWMAAQLLPMRAADLHVATHGHDTWSGTLAVANAEGTDGPFRTLTRAQQAVRELKRTSGLPDGGITIHVSQGLYKLSSPLRFIDADSGTELSPVRYQARPGETVRLSGGEVLANFTPVDPEERRVGKECRSRWPQ